MKNDSFRTTRGWAAFAVAGALLCATAPSAQADEAREAQLEKRIAELEKKLERIADSQLDGSSAGALDARVAELEKLTKKDGGGLFPYWKTGLRMDSADKAFKLKLGGRIMNDYTWFSGDGDVERALGTSLNTGTRFRRARLYMAGSIHKNISFKAQYDFAGGDADFNDVYIQLNDVHDYIGDIRVGHQFEPFGLETQTSSKYITFMERGLVTSFAPGRNTGISMRQHLGDGCLYYAAGAFRQTNTYGDDIGNPDSGQWNFTGRVASKVWVHEDDDANHFLHLGGAYTYRAPRLNTVTIGSRPEVSLAPAFIANALPSEGVEIVNLEALYVNGPWHIQAEHAFATVDITGTGTRVDGDFDATTIQGGYFLTGETRPYDNKNATLGRITPNNDYGDGDGMGAWEIAGRWSQLDANDGLLRGGQMRTYTVGLNWYLNPNTRVMFNWVNAKLNGVGNVDALMMRFQIDF